MRRWLVWSLREKQTVCICGTPVYKASDWELGLAGDIPGGSLGDRSHNQLVDVDVCRPGDGPDDAVGHIGAGQPLHALVDRRGTLTVACEPDQAQFRLHPP